MSAPPLGEQTVYIIGGGLAGMTVAKVLAEHGVKSTILEASPDRLGGKAGADYYKERRVWEDHGYHVFPGWYVNTRQLLKDVGIDGNLIDTHKFYHLLSDKERPGESTQQRLKPFHEITVRNMIRNINSGLLGRMESMLSFYFMADLAAESFRTTGSLDHQSPNSLLRSRFYATENIAQLHQDTTLQASSIPNFEVSANTIAKLGRYWLKTRKPIFSFMNGNLQKKFIYPFQRYLRAHGVTVKLNTKIVTIGVLDGAVNELAKETVDTRRARDGTACCVEDEVLKGRKFFGKPNDIYVLTTPPEVTRAFVSYLFPKYPALSNLVKLRSVPMAALHLYFNRKIPGLPWEHVTLFRSRHGTSFIDISQRWDRADRGKTVLSVIASNFEPLSLLGTKEEMAEVLIQELAEYVPEIREAIEAGDFERDKSIASMQPRTDTPLFLNTIGAWDCRPTASTPIRNLYLAGDYCRTAADLTTMESAISSGIWTAGAILQDLNIVPPDKPIRPLPIPTYPRPVHILLKYLPYPGVRLLSIPITRVGKKRLVSEREARKAPAQGEQ